MSARGKLRLGTRGSELARTQSGTVAAALERLGFAVELTIIKTSGDQNTTSAFASIGPQGVFVRDRSADPSCANRFRLTAGVLEHTQKAVAALEDVCAAR